MFQIEILPENYPIDKSVIAAIVEQFCRQLDIDSAHKILEIKFVDDQEMAHINSTFRHISSTTDVLSFPQTQISTPLEIFGTIVISPQEALKRGEEIEELILHGLLHLAGYDHETDQIAWDRAALKVGHRM